MIVGGEWGRDLRRERHSEVFRVLPQLKMSTITRLFSAALVGGPRTVVRLVRRMMLCVVVF